MLPFLRSLLRRRALRANISRAISSGVGFYEVAFTLPAPNGLDVIPTLLGWCREASARTSRPYGVNYLTLAIALEDETGMRLASETLRVLQPSDFYSEGRAHPDITSVIEGWEASGVTVPERGGRLHVLLFSWGDLTSDLLRAS